MNGLIAVAVVAAGLALPTFAPLHRWTGSTVLALSSAPVASGLVAAGAAVLAVLTGTAILPWFVALAVAVNAISWRGGRAASRTAHLGPWALVTMALVATVGVLVLRPTVLGWDARSIWLLHARWMYGGGDFVRHAMSNPAVAFSHADYPPLIPALVGTTWRVSGGIDLRVGQLVIGVLNLSAVATLAVAFTQVPSRPPVLGAIAGVATGLSAYGFAGAYATNGYADLLVAATSAAAVIYLLVLPANARFVAIGTVMLTAAGLTKNEGLPVALCVAALFVVRMRRRIPTRQLAAVIAVVATVALWPVLARVLGARSDLVEGGRVRNLAAGTHDVWTRLRPTAQAMRHQFQALAIIVAVCAVLGSAFMRGARAAIRVGSAAYLWIVVVASLLATIASYLVSPYDIAWHLQTSIDRTTMIVRLLLVADVAIWLLVAATSRYTDAMATTGRLSFMPPVEPRKGASPKAKIPPSEATRR